jgi:phosphate-selective porin OprO/OprP
MIHILVLSFIHFAKYGNRGGKMQLLRKSIGIALGVGLGIAGSAFSYPTSGPLGGVVRMDQAMFHERASDHVPAPANSANLRNFDIYSQVNFSDTIAFHWELGFGNGFTLDPTFVSYEGLGKNHLLTWGYIPSPFSLEAESSSKTLPFMERALPVTTFAPILGVGGMYHFSNNWSVFKVSLTQPGYGVFADSTADKARGDDPWGGTARGVVAPLISEGKVFHVGGSLSFQNTTPDSQAKPSLIFTTAPELKSRRTENFVSARIFNSRRYYVANLEAAGQWGPLQFDGEYFQALVERRQVAGAPHDDLTFRGWYTQANYFLTGETREYRPRDSRFAGVSNRHAWGALQLAVRYSSVDLNNKDIHGGKEDNIGVALDWYISSNIRWMLNYVRVMVEELPAAPVSRQLDMLGLRLQVMW